MITQEVVMNLFLLIYFNYWSTVRPYCKMSIRISMKKAHDNQLDYHELFSFH